MGEICIHIVEKLVVSSFGFLTYMSFSGCLAQTEQVAFDDLVICHIASQ